VTTATLLNRQHLSLPSDLAAAVAAALDEWQRDDRAVRLWRRDATVWTGGDEARWLGWLGIVGEERARMADLSQFAAEVRRERFTHALLLGMGGSSLAPDVLRATFGELAGAPVLHVLDSTDPAQVLAAERRGPLATTLVVVASKSGTTLEPNILKQYFFARMGAAVGERAGRHFVAITDPGSQLQQVAEHDGFRRTFFGEPTIGGRFSALSRFGLVPAALMGIDVARLLDSAQVMVEACGAARAVRENPGVTLGVALGVAARAGRDKLTIVASPRVAALGGWLEQLVAESTGKDGRAIIPVDGEPLASPAAYGHDRVFVAVALPGDLPAAQIDGLSALEAAGHPVVRIELGDAYGLAQEFFRWEIATAVAGAVMGINPFDQPDVEASKVATRALTAEYEARGALPAESPMLRESGLALLADDANVRALERVAGTDRSAAGVLRAHLSRLKPGDYFALLAYLEMSDAHRAALEQIRRVVAGRFGVATCLGFGPRFLHSTGQAYKGGPDTGVFLQVTCDDREDVAVPGQAYTFGVVKAAQARGDFAVLSERGRRALRVHLGPDVPAGLDQLRRLVAAAAE
jgi:glucose-6-phosphate isomerase